jgi:hypothetical protein
VSVLFAFAAALASALTVVLQHVASTAAPADVIGWRLATYLVRNPMWLCGVLAVVGSFVFQALALYHGRMPVVQSVLITELVFTLIVGRVWLRLEVRPTAWMSASITVLALTGFLLIAAGRRSSRSHHRSLAAGAADAGRGDGALRGTGHPWIAGAPGSLVRHRVRDRGGHPGNVSEIDDGHAGHRRHLTLLTRGPVYGLVAAMFISTVLTQAALHCGPLARPSGAGRPARRSAAAGSS